jgi:hypothetical protein
MESTTPKSADGDCKFCQSGRVLVVAGLPKGCGEPRKGPGFRSCSRGALTAAARPRQNRELSTSAPVATRCGAQILFAVSML